jgi:hypothetical protein
LTFVARYDARVFDQIVNVESIHLSALRTPLGRKYADRRVQAGSQSERRTSSGSTTG